MQQVQVSPFGISIHGRDDLTARVLDLRPATREALAQAIARQAHDSDASAIAEYFWLPAEDLEALVATFAARDAEFGIRPPMPRQELRRCPAGPGIDLVALGGEGRGRRGFQAWTRTRRPGPVRQLRAAGGLDLRGWPVPLGRAPGRLLRGDQASFLTTSIRRSAGTGSAGPAPRRPTPTLLSRPARSPWTTTKAGMSS